MDFLVGVVFTGIVFLIIWRVLTKKAFALSLANFVDTVVTILFSIVIVVVIVLAFRGTLGWGMAVIIALCAWVLFGISHFIIEYITIVLEERQSKPRKDRRSNT